MNVLQDLASHLYRGLFAPSRLDLPAAGSPASAKQRRTFRVQARSIFLHSLWLTPLAAGVAWFILLLDNSYESLNWTSIYAKAGLGMALVLLAGLLRRASTLLTCLTGASMAVFVAAQSTANPVDEPLSLVIYILFFAFMLTLGMGVATATYLGVIMSVGVAIPAGLAVGWAFALSMFIGFMAIFYRLPVYLAEIIWASRCERKLRMDPSSAPQCWREYPIYWDETIAFPLPRTREFLAGLFRFDPAFGLNCAEFIVTERTVHAVAARGALAEATVDILEVARWEEIAALPGRLSWLGENHALAPLELGGMLPRFVRIAEFVGQGLNLHNGYQKAKAVGSAVKEADDLRAALVAASSTVNVRLLPIAKAWRAHLVAELERMEAASKLNREIPTVFRFGVPLGEDAARLFVGRAEVVRDLERLLLSEARPPSVLLYGARRMGKTSVLHQLPGRAGPRVASCFLDCQNPGNRESPARFFASLSLSLVASLKKRDIVIPPLPIAALRDEPFGSFDTWLIEVEAQLPVDLRVFLCFDEYEGLDKTIAAGWGEKLLEYLRHLQQHRRRFLIIFSGVKAFHDLGPLWNRHFVSSRLTRLTFIPAADLERLLREPCEDFNMFYGDGVMEQLLASTNGQPFLTQALALELVEVLNSGRRHLATLADLQAARHNLFSTAQEFFNDLWLDAGAEGQRFLHGLAIEKPVSVSPEVIAHLGFMDVIDAGGNITVPLVAEWLAAPERRH